MWYLSIDKIFRLLKIFDWMMWHAHCHLWQIIPSPMNWTKTISLHHFVEHTIFLMFVFFFWYKLWKSMFKSNVVWTTQIFLVYTVSSFRFHKRKNVGTSYKTTREWVNYRFLILKWTTPLRVIHVSCLKTPKWACIGIQIVIPGACSPTIICLNEHRHCLHIQEDAIRSWSCVFF